MLISKLKSIKENQGLMKYLKNTLWLLGEKILRLFIGLFVTIWAARYLGPEQFGLLSYAISFVGLFAAFSSLGLNGIVVHALVKNKIKFNVLIGTVFWLKFFGAIMILFILSVAVQFTTNDSLTNTLIFIIASATLFQSFNVIDFYFQSKVLSKYVVYSNVIALIISSLLKIILILMKAPLIAFAWIVPFDAVLLAFGYIYFYHYKNLSLRIWTFHKTIAISLLKDSWPLIISSMVLSLYMKLDQVMLKEMLDAKAVGQYAAAATLSQAWYFIPGLISGSLFPAIINAKNISKSLYENRLLKLYTLIVTISVLTAIVTTIFGDTIVQTLYGNAYLQAGNVLIIHIWSGLFAGLLVASGKWIINENLNKHALYRNLFGLISNVILNYFLIQSYGIIGAAYGTLISYVIAGFLYDILFKETRVSFFLKLKALFLFLYWRKNDEKTFNL